MVTVIRASELREQTREQVKEQLAFCRREYQRVLQEKHSRSVNPEDIRTARKNIARCKHILGEQRLKQLVEEYKGKRIIPKELRPKLNKNLRMQLTEKQLKRRTKNAAITAAKTRSKIFSYQE